MCTRGSCSLPLAGGVPVMDSDDTRGECGGDSGLASGGGPCLSEALVRSYTTYVAVPKGLNHNQTIPIKLFHPRLPHSLDLGAGRDPQQAKPPAA